MSVLWETVDDLHAGADTLRRRRYGVIETAAGCLAAVHLRPWPKLLTLGGVWRTPDELARGGVGDRCLLYYNQPRRLSSFLALRYVVSTLGASLGTVRQALAALDEIARIKQTDAIVCEAWNRRISERLLCREGWERHLPQSGRRHYIKRFYGTYPEATEIHARTLSRESEVNTELTHA